MHFSITTICCYELTSLLLPTTQGPAQCEAALRVEWVGRVSDPWGLRTRRLQAYHREPQTS